MFILVSTLIEGAMHYTLHMVREPNHMHSTRGSGRIRAELSHLKKRIACTVPCQVI